MSSLGDYCRECFRHGAECTCGDVPLSADALDVAEPSSECELCGAFAAGLDNVCSACALEYGGEA